MIEPFKSKTRNRLKRLKGQVEGIIRMIDKDEYCVDILTQVLALQGAIKGVSELILESHLNTCGKRLISEDKKVRQKFIDELLQTCKLTTR